MEEIDLKELFNYYIKKFPIIILTMLLTSLIGYGYVKYLQVPQYEGTTTIILVQNKEEEEINGFDNTENQLEINEKLVTTYSEIIKSRRVLDQVIEKLKLNTDLEELTKKITVKAISNTSIIEITIKDKNNKKAAKIANTIADIFKVEITQIYNLENVSVIDEAIVEEEPCNVNIPVQIIVAAIMGIIISIVMIFIMYYFDNSIKGKNEIEEKLNLPVLGEIPVASKLDKKKKKEKKKKISKKILETEKKETKEQVIEEPIIVIEENTTSDEKAIIPEEEKTIKKTTPKKSTKTTKEKTDIKIKKSDKRRGEK